MVREKSPKRQNFAASLVLICSAFVYFFVSTQNRDSLESRVLSETSTKCAWTETLAPRNERWLVVAHAIHEGERKREARFQFILFIFFFPSFTLPSLPATLSSSCYFEEDRKKEEGKKENKTEKFMSNTKIER